MSQENVDFVLDRYARLNAGERVPDLDFWHGDGNTALLARTQTRQPIGESTRSARSSRDGTRPIPTSGSSRRRRSPAATAYSFGSDSVAAGEQRRTDRHGTRA